MMPQMIVDVGHTKYPLYIGQDIIKDAGNKFKSIFSQSRVVIISDTTVFSLYGNKLESSLDSCDITYYKIVLPPGEGTKSFDALTSVYDELVRLGIQKTDVIVALGGGVIGDLSGFAASTYLRGINFVQIPTTLLAQVDSSIGGKVAVNLPMGKNLVGSFYHPKMVIIDTDVLQTLSDKDFASGMAEIIKTGAIMDGRLFKLIEDNAGRKEITKVIEQVVTRCCEIKGDVVRRDELDNGIRMLLNFGHTLAHAIEKMPDNIYTHGEAVAIGMVQFSMLGEKLGLTEKGTAVRLEKLVNSFDLPDSVDMDKDKLIEIMSRDKKIRDNQLKLILLKTIGKSFIHKIPISNIGELI
jgi:3-dehydroquinate synthase